MNRLNAFSAVDPDIYVGECEFFNFREASKIINQKGLGRNNLLKLLREKGILDKWNTPTEKLRGKGFIRTIDNSYLTPLISSYGIKYLQKYVL